MFNLSCFMIFYCQKLYFPQVFFFSFFSSFLFLPFLQTLWFFLPPPTGGGEYGRIYRPGNFSFLSFFFFFFFPPSFSFPFFKPFDYFPPPHRGGGNTEQYTGLKKRGKKLHLYNFLKFILTTITKKWYCGRKNQFLWVLIFLLIRKFDMLWTLKKI